MALERFVSNALTSMGAVEQNGQGKFYIDAQAVNVELSQVIAETIYAGQIFRDGMNCTGKYVNGMREGGAVRILLDTPLPFASRTLSFGGKKGTVGNDGIVNANAPVLPATQDFMVYLTQVNDQMLLFSELSKQFLPLDIVSKKVAQYGERVQMDRDASTLAEVLAYNIWRSLNDGDNINTFDNTVDGAYNELLTTLNTKLDNGDIASSVYSFATSGRCIIARPSFINGLFGSKAGIILNGSNMAQEMLVKYDINASMNDRKYVGTNYKGNAMQFDFVMAPDYIWTLAEQYLQLPKGAFSHIKGVALSFEAVATANNVDLGVKVIDSINPRGSIAQPLNIWGHEAFRKCQLIGDTQLSNTLLTTIGFSDSDRKYPVAPQQALFGNEYDKVTVPIYDEVGAIVGYREVAKAPVPNGGGISETFAQVVAPTIDTTTLNATTITTTTQNATIYYTVDGSVPTINSNVYANAIDASDVDVIKAIAVKDGMVVSAVTTVDLT